MDNLTNNSLLDDMQLDLIIYRLSRVGRKNMSSYDMWLEWINR